MRKQDGSEETSKEKEDRKERKGFETGKNEKRRRL